MSLLSKTKKALGMSKPQAQKEKDSRADREREISEAELTVGTDEGEQKEHGDDDRDTE